VSADDHAAIARAILDSNRYMTLATADEFGRPWASPVYFAPTAGYRELYWVSDPQARHSRNIAERALVSIVVFDSQLAINSGQAVYMSGAADQPSGDELERGIAVFSARSQQHGAQPWAPADVLEDDGLRLYRATIYKHWILKPDPLSSDTADTRISVTF
jgi:uncharacterized protein YhbP (UPF0306 family)